MSDFTFSCPSCHQTIQAAVEHSGLEVECPLCQARLVIPEAPGQPAAAPAPAQGKSKLQMAPSTVEEKPQGFAGLPPPPKKKKKKKFPTEAVVGWTTLAVVVLAGIFFGPKLWHKYQEHQEAAAAAAEAAKLPPPPPPPPPEPAAAEIMQKVIDKYKGMTTFAADGKTATTLDLSALAPNNPQLKAVTFTADTGIQIGRPDLFRLEWSLHSGPASLLGAAWSAGRGAFFANGASSLRANRPMALAQAASVSGTVGAVLVKLFFDDPDSIASAADQFTKQKSQLINNVDCYVLAGPVQGGKLQLWIGKKDYLIDQAEQFLEGTIDPDLIKSQTNAAMKSLLTRASKTRGSVTEAYSNFKIDSGLTALDFEKSILPSADLAAAMAAPAPAAAPPGGQRGGGRQGGGGGGGRGRRGQ